MKKVYTHENRFFVSNAKNIVDGAGIQTLLKNEYAAGACGDLAPIDAWMELWVVNERDEHRAKELIDEAFNDSREGTWICPHCQEKNPAAFDFCWACQADPRF